MMSFRFAAPVLAVILATTIAACGGGGYLPSPLSATEPRPLPAEYTSRKAVSYSPYRTATSESNLGSEVITAANVQQDLELIRAAGIGMIRLFSSRAFSETVLSVIRSNGIDLKVMLGAYVNPVYDAAAEADNQAELDQTIALANQYSDIVLAVSVGNETMVSWSTHKISPEVMAGYLLKARQGIRQPVTTDDNWAFWAAAPKVITDVVDFAAVHTYPLLDTFYDPGLWEWRMRDVPAAQRAAAMADAAIAEAKRQAGQSRAFLDRIGLAKLPMVIGETGWVAVDNAGGPELPFRAHAVNQKLYYERLQAWADEGRSGAGPKAVFVFQAFDEQWKQGDDGWGLFTKERRARCAVQALNPPSASWVYDSSQSCDATAAVYFVPAVVNDPLPTATTRYTLFSDAALASGEQRAAAQRWDAFGNPRGGVTAGYPVVGSAAAPGDGSQSIEITPQPADYGWGLLLHFSDATTTVNLSGFAQGALKFWIRTNNYPGKIEIGMFSDTDDRAGAQAFLQIAPGQYGYCASNAWCEVTIPIAAFVAANPALDLRLVNTGFVISDRFAFTGKPEKTTGLPAILVDGIAWTR